MTITGKQVLASTLTVLGVGAMTIIPASADEYTVKQGDTVSELAQHFNTTAEQITKDSKLADSNIIFIGEKLEITMNKKDTETKIVVPEVKQVTPVQPVEVSTPTPSQPVQAQPKQEAPVEAATTVSNSAKDIIAHRESRGDYNAMNPSGAYGKYQLMPFNLKYGTSPAGQERAADEYVAERYGNWDNALSAWNAQGWY